MDLASVVAALASVGVGVSGSAPNSSVQVDSSRACPPGLAGPEPSGTINDLGQHFHIFSTEAPPAEIYISEYQESTGFFYHNVSVIFPPSVLMVNVSATVSWLAILR